jgi:hypothetical protein
MNIILMPTERTEISIRVELWSNLQIFIKATDRVADSTEDVVG